MSKQQTFWIRDVEGVFAQVGAEVRDLWTKVRGWVEADEPGPTDQVHVVNEHPEIGPARLPYGVVPDLAGLGWSAGPPPDPNGQSPAPVDQPVAEPVKPTKSAASAAVEQKEK
jgi:hypothetical protein